MAEFQYQGVDRAGKRVKGKMEASNEGELRMILRGQGIRPTRVGKANFFDQDIASMFRGGAVGRIPLDNLSVFTRQLHVLVGSGIPLVQSLEVLGEQTPHPGLRRVTASVKEKVSSGSFLWEALNVYAKSLPRIYIALVRAGESSGAMETVLDRLAVYLENLNRIIKMVKSAMMYPVVVGLVGVAVIVGMLTFVIPKMEDMLKSSGQKLPAITQIIIDLSRFLTTNFLAVGAGIGGAAYLFIRYARSEEGRGVIQNVMFRVPIFGELLQKAGIARFARTLSTLLSAGVNLIDAIEISRETVDNAVLEDAIKIIRRDIEQGKSLGVVLNKLKVFPKMAVQMVAVGESTGNLENMLERLADIYESDVETLVSGMSKLLEPFILVFLGGIVAFIMIAMYLPIFKIAGSATGGH